MRTSVPGTPSLRSVSLPHAKTTSDLANMLAGRTMAWEDYEAPGLPVIWQEYTDLDDRDTTNRSRHSGEPNISFSPHTVSVIYVSHYSGVIDFCWT